MALLLNAAAPLSNLWDRFLADPHVWWGHAWLAALLLAALCAGIALASFKTRISQIRWIDRGLMFQLLALGSATGLLTTVGPLGTRLLSETIGFGMVALAAVALLLARRGVRKDEALVRSMDRIR